MDSLIPVRFELLNKDNFDTWKLQMWAILVKNGLWRYVKGEIPEPRSESESKADWEEWKEGDDKAKAEIILSVVPSELHHIKYCSTSQEVWQKLQDINESKGPAKRATLLKQLILSRMTENDDACEHIRKFCNIVDKLKEMDVLLDKDLLAIILLHSLPPKFENFRNIIESSEPFSTLEQLCLRIIEENQMVFNQKLNDKNIKNEKPKINTRVRCNKCREFGHKANICKLKASKSS